MGENQAETNETTDTEYVKAAGEVGILIGGKAVTFTESSGKPFIDSANRTQVPLRAAMETFGCAVGWNQESKTAIVEKDGITVKVPIGQKYILVNGKKVETDTTAQVIAGRTYLPIRAVLESFGAEVSWDAQENNVIVK